MTVCSRCGKENQDHYKFCLGCGGDLHTQPPVIGSPGNGRHDEDASAPAHRDRRAGGRRESPVFASSVAGRGGSGRHAGVTAAQPASMAPPVMSGSPLRSCPTCGKPVPWEFVFCGSCGTRLGAMAPPAGSGPRNLHGGQASPMVAPQPRGRLVLIRPDGGEGGSMPLVEGETMIGRSEGPLFESDSYLSPQHAIFYFHGAQLVVRDAGSLNGVFAKMNGEEEIADAEVFRLGQELLRFDIIGPAEPLDDGTEVMGSPNPGYWGRLSVILGRGQDGSAFPLFGESMIIGRERGDILFPEDGYVSGTHARISRRDGRFFLSDLNSSNGSFLRIRAERPLRSGAFLLLGQQLFRVQYT